MNPIAAIDTEQSVPQKYNTSPNRTDGSYQGCYNEYDQPEVFVQNDEEIDLEQIEKNLENEDMLAMTQHNQ